MHTMPVETTRKALLIAGFFAGFLAALIWLLGDVRTIGDDAKIFFRRADLPEDAEVDPNADWKSYEPKYRDSFSEIDPDEGDHARECLRGKRHLCRELADALPDIGLGDPVNEFRIERSRRDHCRADVVGLHLHSQPFGDDAHGML